LTSSHPPPPAYAGRNGITLCTSDFYSPRSSDAFRFDESASHIHERSLSIFNQLFRHPSAALNLSRIALASQPSSGPSTRSPGTHHREERYRNRGNPHPQAESPATSSGSGRYHLPSFPRAEPLPPSGPDRTYSTRRGNPGPNDEGGPDGNTFTEQIPASALPKLHPPTRSTDH
jgi:hypothetical protein